MSLVELYRSRFAGELDYQPVWSPGSAVAPGDVGEFRNGVFSRGGAIGDMLRVPLQLVRTPMPAPMKFSDGASFSAHASAGGNLDPGIKVAGSIKFDAAGGVAFHARDIVHLTIGNLDEVLAAIPWGDDSWEDRLFVSEVLAARAVAVALADSAGAAVELSGKAGALASFELADASVGFGAASAASYSLSLADDGTSYYPFALVLRRRKRNWPFGRYKPGFAGADSETAPVADRADEEVSPFDAGN